jgi:hypothetical protein
VYPSRHCGKRWWSLLAAFAAIALVAGCGGGGNGETSVASGREVTGPGFAFQAPEGWTIKTLPTAAEARQDPSTVVSVNVLPLVRPYRLALFPRVAKELNRVASSYAASLRGTMTSKRTVVVAGRKARQYEIVHGDLVDRITFVLRAKRNYQLTCRWRDQDGEPAACAQLVASFAFR